MAYWLVIVLAGATAPLHVGNFASLADCQSASNDAVVESRGHGTAPGFEQNPVTFLCVRASDGKLNPPS